ncbi:MAG: ParB/RepB/Spo0J family partition protein [Candidatus Dadabacteria bacterium]|nr:MAG: ParB/RepB/Spo0J family partition protein [Candidatus Dadabacteria bacterium]
MESAPRIVLVPWESIEPNPFNIRTDLGPDALAGLAASIEQRGLIHPVLVRPHPDPERYGQYQLVCGERRYRAIGLLRDRDPERWAHVPARVESLDDTAALAAIMQENELREDWSPYERAAFFRAIYDAGHFRSIREMARKFGIGLTTMHRYLRVFDLPDRIIALFRAGRLPLALIEVVLEAPRSIQIELAEHLAKQPCSKAEARRLAQRLAQPALDPDWIDRVRAAASSAPGIDLRPLDDDRVQVAITVSGPDELLERLEALRGQIADG